MRVYSRIKVATRIVAHQPILVELTNALANSERQLILYGSNILKWRHFALLVSTRFQHRHVMSETCRYHIRLLATAAFKSEFIAKTKFL